MRKDTEPKPLNIKRVLPLSELTGDGLAQFVEFTGARMYTNETQTTLRIGDVEVVLGDMPRVQIEKGHESPTVFDLFDSAVIFSPTGDYAFVRPDVKPDQVHIVSVSQGKPDWAIVDIKDCLPHVQTAAGLLAREESAA